jgi:putative oxidoreductase
MSDGVDANKLYFPGLAGLYKGFSSYSYALMRFAAGAVLVPHGIQKIVNNSAAGLAGAIDKQGLPAPLFLAWLTIIAESVVAACLAVGLFTRLAALIIFIEMTVIITLFQWQFGYFWTNRGIEYALLWWLLCIAIFFRGGGKYSVDALIGKEF